MEENLKTEERIFLKSWIQKFLYFIAGILLFFGIWYAFIFILTKYNNNLKTLPYPLETLKDFWYLLFNPIDGKKLFAHALASLFRVMYGCLYAIVLGVSIGIAMGTNKHIEKILRPIIEMFRPIPPIAWIPFAIIAFGLGLLSQAFVIFIGAFFPIMQNTYDGIKQRSKVFQDVALSLGASKSQISFEVILPSIIPNLFTGLRTGIGVGWMCVIAAEMMGISGNIGGIGYFISYMKNIGNYSYMMAGMLMIALVGLGLNGLFHFLEKEGLKWM